jgi:cell division protein FtsQ
VNTRAQPRPARPANDPRVPRRRPVSAQRAAGRRRLRVLIVVGTVGVLLAAAWAVSVSPLLDIDHLEVRGVHHLTAAQVEQAGDVHPGDAMAWLDPGKVTSRIEALPYVRTASAAREWPDTVRITVHERRPAAWVDSPGGKALVDGTGRVLELVLAPPAGLPQLLGTRVIPPAGATITPADGARVAAGLAGLDAGRTTSVEVTDHGVVLHLGTGPEIRMGDANRIAVKVRAAFAVLGAPSDIVVNYVDVSVPTNPVAG